VPARKLILRREPLTELAPADLAAVNGASGLPCDLSTGGCVAVTQLCPSHGCTGYYPTIERPCD
jgi:hypothetical protein